MEQLHHYKTIVQWTGNRGHGTLDYKSYDRNHVIKIEGKPDLLGSSDPSFRGDASMHNPEDLFVSAISACHMLWYLHLCSDHKIIVTEYIDEATGTMMLNKDGSGHFTEINLHPRICITDRLKISKAMELHEDAHKYCFLANSVKFPVTHQPVITV